MTNCCPVRHTNTRRAWPPASAPLWRIAAVLAITALLGACANGPVPPDWQGNAQALLKSYQGAWLRGSSATAERDFVAARAEIASTGRTDLVARAELLRCATRAAALTWDTCPAFATLRLEAQAADQAYANFLDGRGQNPDLALLPAHYRALLSPATPTAATDRLSALPDPLARLVGASVLLKMAQITPGEVTVATETASAQGWRRPLRAWLGVQARQAQAAGQSDALARIQRRIELVQSSAPPVH